MEYINHHHQIESRIEKERNGETRQKMRMGAVTTTETRRTNDRIVQIDRIE